MTTSDKKLFVRVLYKNGSEVTFYTNPKDEWTPENIISALKTDGHLHIVDFCNSHHLVNGEHISYMQIRENQ